jgi:hypothetical protein
MVDLPKGFTPEEFFQKIRDLNLHEDLKFDPETVNQWFISNIFMRAFAHLVGFDGVKELRLKCDSAGRLLISVAQSAFQHYKVYTYTAIGALVTEVFPQVVNHIYINTTAGSGKVEFSLDGVVYGDDIYIPSGAAMGFDIQAASMKIGSWTGTYTAYVNVFY